MKTQNQYDLLFIDQNKETLKILEELAVHNQWTFMSLMDGKEALDYLDRYRFRVVLVELNLSDFSGLQILEWMKTQPRHVEVILMTSLGSVDSAVTAFKQGAFDYLLKPFEALHPVESCIRQALDKSKLLNRMEQFEPNKEDEENIDAIIGKSSKMQAVFEMIRQVSASQSNILLQGESGTGKELVAKAIHRHGPRSDKPFVVINCAAMPDTLLESELFGYLKGAFTGATQDKLGLFEVADGGTVFLDEIGEVALSTQVKLLRVLQGGEILPLGCASSRYVDVRVIAASNKDLQSLIQSGRFREDLYYRLNVICIQLPPLRARSEDVPLLAYYFLKKISKKIGKPVEKISVDVLQALQNYNWPGNVRELENVIERAVVLSEGDSIRAKNLAPKILSTTFYTPSASEDDLSEFSYKEAKKRALNIFNRSYIMNLLEKSKGNITAASEKAGMDRSNFKKIIRKYGIDSNQEI